MQNDQDYSISGQGGVVVDGPGVPPRYSEGLFKWLYSWWSENRAFPKRTVVFQ